MNITDTLQSIENNEFTKVFSELYGTDVGRILRTFKIKKNVEVTDNGKDNF